MPELDENGNPIDPEPKLEGGDTLPKDGEPPEEEEPSFSKKQMEQLATLVGRISKKQLEENVIPLIQARREEVIPSGQQSDAIKEFNETLQQKIFAGDVLGAIQMATDVQNRAKDTLTRTQVQQVEKNIVSYAEKPFYKDIHSEMDKIAKEAIKNGVPPEWAVEHAYHKALSEHLSSNRGGGDEDGGSLDMVSGGKPQRRSKEAKLPEHFKAAAARDIAKGLFKDEKDYISNLSPKVREQYGI